MNNRVFDADLKDLIEWSATQYRVMQQSGIVSSGVVDRVHAGLGGSHTVVTYPPLDALRAIDASEVLSAISPVESLDLYYHVAFCEFLCPFCHYDTWFRKLGEANDSAVDAYVRALLDEHNTWYSKLGTSRVTSIYVGGGTPTALSLGDLDRLLDSIRRWRTGSELQFCVETSPLTATASDGVEKLHLLVAAGVNRVSVGIQSFNETLLTRSRGHGTATALVALDRILSVIDNINVDLIQDLPGQTDSHVLEDLDAIRRFLPAQVTWYVMRLRPEAGWYKRFERNALDVPNSSDSLRRRLLIHEGMKRLGYSRHPGGRFVRDALTSDYFKKVRAGLAQTLLGLGVSAYSHGWNMMFRNTYTKGKTNALTDYIRQVAQNGNAIATGMRIGELETVASAFVSGIRDGITPPVATAATAEYLVDAETQLRRLESVGLVTRSGSGRWSLSESGGLFEEEICSLFYSREMRARLTETERHWADDVSSRGSPETHAGV